MKNTQRFLMRIVSVFMIFGQLVLPVFAASTTFVEHEGLEILVEMDKEQYDDYEPITATITVTNTNPDAVMIANAEQLIPNGYRLAENSDSSLENIELRPAQTVVLKVTFEKIPAESSDEIVSPDDFFDKIIYGSTWGLPNLLIAFVLVAAFVVFMLLT